MQNSPMVSDARWPSGEPDDLFRRTLKTMGILVGACVVFVGTLSLLAVFIAGRAVGSGSSSSSSSTPAAEMQSSPTGKKPVSI